MKAIIITIALASVAFASRAQTKPESAVKPKLYQVGFVLDSAGYAAMQAGLNALYSDIDNSNIPHNRVKEDERFLTVLFQQFEAEKKNQDVPVKPVTKVTH